MTTPQCGSKSSLHLLFFVLAWLEFANQHVRLQTVLPQLHDAMDIVISLIRKTPLQCILRDNSFDIVVPESLLPVQLHVATGQCRLPNKQYEHLSPCQRCRRSPLVGHLTQDHLGKTTTKGRRIKNVVV